MRFEYCRKLATLKKSQSSLSSVCQKLLTNSCSLEILTTSSKDPFLNWPAKAPIDVETAGMILVKSFSCTRTPVILEMP